MVYSTKSRPDHYDPGGFSHEKEGTKRDEGCLLRRAAIRRCLCARWCGVWHFGDHLRRCVGWRGLWGNRGGIAQRYLHILECGYRHHTATLHIQWTKHGRYCAIRGRDRRIGGGWWGQCHGCGLHAADFHLSASQRHVLVVQV